MVSLPRSDSHVVLVGMMGAGKSSVGRELADRLHRPFFDTDALVEAAERASVEEIFASRGEPAFRLLERKAVRTALGHGESAVISMGGGAVLDEATRADLAGAGLVVWLRATPETLARRVLGQNRPGARPLLDGAGSPEQGAVVLGRVGHQRESLYRSVASEVLDVDSLDVDGVVALVMERLAQPAQPTQPTQPAQPAQPAQP